ncbi:bifunctional riboflavin kinase/FAD synthetase [Larsenimonas rhizosphaerae]|uniref:Riboflavin biosynthesis protein n=1 Tax=Larsenimonas rhizosphaerae TaxID=2944682 RepID=A0AA41ZP13_9GAMM|nr:bifunctional riboflavin kinase/FAD synthetase [Larsenimonas rhizosphaerae]MCX2525478.1 bifunctional riboflavin kinase/FAD synthetase [Larsenimonas rhizosphaerae]
MELIRGLHTLAPHHRGCVATIGNFDGVHLGHQAILEQLRQEARRLDLPVTVVIFEPQPREFFAGDQAPPRLMRMKEKVRLLHHYGADRVLCLPFNRRLRELSAHDFIRRVLVDGLGVRHLVVGDDFRFGCDRAGDFALLQREGEDCGFRVEHTRTFMMDNDRVSSTRIRTMLASGNFRQAARLLGRPYRFRGRVIRDRQLGRTIGIPTANLPLLPGPMVLRGVYAVLTRLDDGQVVNGVANVGWRPTVGAERPVLEVHLFDVSPSLYGRIITVVPCARLRGEEKFDSIDAMMRCIQRDISMARTFFAAQASRPSLDDDAACVPASSVSISDPVACLPLASAPLAYSSTDQDDG